MNQRPPTLDTDDIPEALREGLPVKRGMGKLPPLLLAGGLGLLALAVVPRLFWPSLPSSAPQAKSLPSPTPEADPIANVLGHLPYAEAPASELQAVTAGSRLRLRKAAAEKFRKMQADAGAAGISLTLISGFRSISEQEYLFFRVKEQRNQATSKRAEVSAPPGHSEHHTGYAIDIGDGRAPGANLQPSFEKTAAFRWLQENANRYSFELSFPPNNPQGISYEPWHWRYVGDRHSLETFYHARELEKSADSK